MYLQHIKQCRRVVRSALIASALALTVGVAPPTAASPPIAADHPPVDVAAFHDHGQLAFQWAGRLYLLDGARGTLRSLPLAGPVTDLTWSSDSRWLAYIQITDSNAMTGQVSIVRADGSKRHRISGLPAPASTIVWSPVTATLAVLLSAGTSPAPGLWLVSPLGSLRRVAIAAASIAWAPDGMALAYSLTLPFHNPLTRSDALDTVSARGGAPTRRFVARDDGIQVAGWWPTGRGVMFWRDPLHAASIAADGLDLYTLPFGGTPRRLGHTLTAPDALAWSPSGRDLLLVTGGGREAWHDKVLTLCAAPTGGCHSLWRHAREVALDPAWAPQGRRIAFVAARDLGPVAGFGTARTLMSWVQTRTLWVTDMRGRAAQVHAAGRGVYAPEWSHDGRELLYVRGSALWLIQPHAGLPVKIADLSLSSPSMSAGYGYLPWSIAFAWTGR